MPEERKPAPLPPLPWIWESSNDGWIRLFDADNRLIARIDDEQPTAGAVAEMFCRAQALESELHAAREQAKFALEFLNERDSARALLRELAKETQSVINRLDDGAILQADDPRLTRVRSILRRVEAEAGEENANG